MKEQGFIFICLQMQSDAVTLHTLSVDLSAGASIWKGWESPDVVGKVLVWLLLVVPLKMLQYQLDEIT